MKISAPSVLKLFVVSLCGAALTAAVAAAQTSVPGVPQWSAREFVFRSDERHANPYTEVELTATFTGPGGERHRVRGFWDGGATFKLRFTPTRRGRWAYVTSSSDSKLNDRRGGFECVAPRKGARGFLRRDPAHPYHFVWDDGARHFMFGTTYYALMQNAMAGDRWKEAVERSRQVGINKVRVLVAPPFGPDHAKVKYPAAQAFVGGDHDRLNPAHYQKLDEVVRHMADKDMNADLILFWNSDDLYGTPEQDRRYARYVIARYAAFPNVIWCLTNEWNYTPKPIEYWNELGAFAAREDPYARRGDYLRLLSVHQQTRHDFQFFGQRWLSHAIVQLGVRNQGKTFRGGNEWHANNAAAEGRTFRHGDEWGNFSITYNWGHDLPVVNDEYGYIGEPEDQSVPKDAAGKHPPLTRDKHRHVMWGIYAAGGYAAAGDKNAYADGSPYFSANWHDTPEYADIKHLVDFFTTKGVEYWKLATQNDVVRAGARVYASGEPGGRQFVIYAAQGGEFTLMLPPGKYVAQRFDPRTGEIVALNNVEGGRPGTLRMPDARDWVVYLRRAANGRVKSAAN